MALKTKSYLESSSLFAVLLTWSFACVFTPTSQANTIDNDNMSNDNGLDRNVGPTGSLAGAMEKQTGWHQKDVHPCLSPNTDKYF
jgi:hypothetical protein